MKCKKCGHEMPDGVKFCKLCGTPADLDQTMLAEGEPVAAPDTAGNGDKNTTVRDYDLSAFEDKGTEGARPRRERRHDRDDTRDDGRTRYRSERHDDRGRYDDDFDEANRSGSDLSRGRYADADASKTGKKRNSKKNIGKKPLIISIVALVLVIAIVLSIILIISRNTVSAAELNEAKEKFLPPAQAVTIDTSLSDPSNDKIKFTFDDRARITSCTYQANEKTYAQSYTYDDSARNVNIVTSYRKHPIFNKDIGYDKVTTANTFESVEGYYLRLDDASVKHAPGASAAVTSQPPAAVTSSAADPPAEETTEPPTEAPTEKPTQATENNGRKKHLVLYEAYMANLDSCDYNLANLIYLNDDDTPEVLLSNTNQPKDYTILWIAENDTVAAYTTNPANTFLYAERGGTFFTNNAVTGITDAWLYTFDGSNVTSVETEEQDPSCDKRPSTNQSNPSHVRHDDNNGGYYFSPGWH